MPVMVLLFFANLQTDPSWAAVSDYQFVFDNTCVTALI